MGWVQRVFVDRLYPRDVENRMDSHGPRELNTSCRWAVDPPNWKRPQLLRLHPERQILAGEPPLWAHLVDGDWGLMAHDEVQLHM